MVRTKGQVYYEDVKGGTEIPPLEKRPSYAQLFVFSASQRILGRIHYDQAFARSEEHPDVIVQSPLHGAFVVQLLTDWIGDEGFLKRISYSNRGISVPGDVLTCKGKVTKKYEEDGQHFVECEVWEENQRGEVLVPGSAVVILPSRHAKR
ncbi:MAG: acyl dehydratase [Chloroflexota bacterium]